MSSAPVENAFVHVIRAAGLVCGVAIGSSALAVPVGTTFTYQGLLKDGGMKLVSAGMKK